MKTSGRLGIVLLGSVLAGGCAAPQVDFATMKRPDRAPELDAYNVFVGSWDFKAQVANAEGGSKDWTGTAKWEWTLDNRCLHGIMSSKSADAAFDAAGVWSWHPTKRQYIWWMFNNWGYPQEGTANYDEAAKTWTMDYASVGLDGTLSYGQYKMKVIDPNKLDWCMIEWADALRTITKIEMTGTYTRKP